jgi:hypothetical protein
MYSMMIHLKIAFTAILTILVFGSFSFRPSPPPAETKYILVKNAFFKESGILKPNAALLITNETEIQENEALFLNNHASAHTCGYHYAIQFWKNPEELIDDIPFNEECERFTHNDRKIQSKMRAYIRQLETKPTHYIYNLKIPVTADPQTIVNTFSNSDLKIFFLRGKSEHYASVTLAYSSVTPIKNLDDRSKWDQEQKDNAENATKKIMAIIENIQAIEPIVEQSNITFPWESFGGGNIEHVGEITLRFRSGTDLTKIKQTIIAGGGRIEGEQTPESYFVQLVDASENVRAVRAKLKDYPIVTGVYEYPQRD